MPHFSGVGGVALLPLYGCVTVNRTTGICDKRDISPLDGLPSFFFEVTVTYIHRRYPEKIGARTLDDFALLRLSVVLGAPKRYDNGSILLDPISQKKLSLAIP